MKYKSPGQSNPFALLPFIIFIAIYLGAGLYFQAAGVSMAFYQFPSVTAMFIAVLSAFCLSRDPVMYKFGIFSRGAGNDNIMTMLMIYILAGAFSAVAAAMGGRDATVNLGMSLIPPQYLTVGIFLISAFMGTATGTSMGTVAAIIPIAAGMAEKSGLPAPLLLGACVSGAMFGDNLSMISDTTIAATRTQGCDLKDKFKMNFLIALPAALLTIAVFLFAPVPAAEAAGHGDFTFWKVLPYVAVLLLALLGVNVFLVLVSGIFLAGIIGLSDGSLSVISFARQIWAGFTSMNEAFFLALFCGGISEMISYYGGIAWLIEKLQKNIHSSRTAQLGIALLVSLVDAATANNTVAIIVSGDVARKISARFHVDPRKSASLLDIFSCVFQGIIPYGAQMLMAAGLGHVSPIEIMQYLYYPYLLGAGALLAIAFNYPRKYTVN